MKTSKRIPKKRGEGRKREKEEYTVRENEEKGKASKGLEERERT